MHLDVQTLRNFYYRSALGRAAQSVVRGKLTELWPVEAVTGMSIAGFGFAVPLLRPYLPEARRVIGLMPGPQGVMPWPAGLPNVSVLCEEALWPVETGHVDRLVMMHGLETSELPAAVMNETYRVLGPGGKALFVVPNRAGIWARRDGTPFGYGRPYSPGQLEAQLKAHSFMPERAVTVLYQPPKQTRFWRKMGPVAERFGAMLPVMAGGVLMVEASKRLPAPVGPGTRERVRRTVGVLAPEPQAEPSIPRRGG